MSRRPTLTIREILHPQSVAVVGASESKEKFGGRVMHYLIKHGYQGRLVPINPGRSQVLGRPCYPSVDVAPGPIDVAMLALPPDALESVLEECGQVGVGCCIIPTTGFEMDTPEGAAALTRLVEISQRYGTRLVGPNCLGIINPHHHLALNASTVMEAPELPKGDIGLISQSGALMVSIHDRAHSLGIGFSACISIGNQADLEICDFLEYMVDDPVTRAICLYVEGFKDAQRFRRAAEAARRARKPIIMYKLGRTAAGVRAARSHTASLAGDFMIAQAVFPELAVILTDDPHDGMVQAADLLTRWGEPRGDGIGLMALSGGGMSVMADRLAENGLRLAALQQSTKDSLRTLLRPQQADNPVDLGGLSSDVIGTAARTMAVLSVDPDVSANLIVLSAMPRLAEVTAELASAALDSGKPTVVIVTPALAGDRARETLRRLRCPFYDRMDDAIRIFKIWTAYGHALQRPAAARATRPSLPAGAEEAVKRAPAGQLTEPEAKALVAAYGIPVNPGRMTTTSDDAVAAARAVGYPVALKAVSRQVVHKTAVGAVRLGLADDDSVRTAFEEVTAAVRRHSPAATVEGCLVQAMVFGVAELLVGVRRDPQFGPVVLIGSGGIRVELLRDIQIALAPISTERALELLLALRIWPALEGRGRLAMDFEATAEIVSRMSWLAADLGDRLIDLEANPVLMRHAGGGAVAVDARGSLAEGQAQARRQGQVS